jgi:hypothetical protein
VDVHHIRIIPKLVHIMNEKVQKLILSAIKTLTINEQDNKKFG